MTGNAYADVCRGAANDGNGPNQPCPADPATGVGYCPSIPARYSCNAGGKFVWLHNHVMLILVCVYVCIGSCSSAAIQCEATSMLGSLEIVWRWAER